ncbi:MAG TPA: efflux transporter outer membrane subunit [Candidatus Acidoferrales bacterium]|jgi:multidrug efflux system outer membrane protein|nr:efflux transporter outer membrane subunit [Candidatus Acidoferrales bacterium]
MRSNLRKQIPAAAAIVVLFLSGCTVGPNYHRPDAPTATAWKAEDPWRPGEPRDQLPKGEWWKVFGDADLDALEAKAMGANPTLQAGVARLEQARATARLTVAGLYPQAGVGASPSRARESGNRPFMSESGVGSAPITQSTYQLSFNVAYETDLFGRVRRNIEASNASLQASAADLEGLRLLIASEIAADYYTVREIDAEIGVLDGTVEDLEKGLQLVEARAHGGVASGLDVAQEKTLLDSTRTQAILLHQQRTQFEDAIGALTGQPASNFKLAEKPMPQNVPAIPIGLPSDLLERRPDVAEAERNMAGANALIGVAKSAYYPDLSLSGGSGLQSFSISTLATLSSGYWAIGAAIAESVLTGGARKAQVQFAEAGYSGAVANYRGAVLTAFQEVEDNLAGLGILDQAAKAQGQAVNDARTALNIATNRYVGGLVSYLDVVTAQQTLLSNEQLAAEIEGQRLVTSVLLIKALGGGWDAASIAAMRVKPSIKQAIEP